MNIWDWELLANPSEERIKDWRKECYQRHYTLYGISLSSDEITALYEQLLENSLFWAIANLQNFWLHWVWVVKYRLFHTWYQNLNEDKQHLVHGRGLIYLTLNDQRKIDSHNCAKLSACWAIPSRAYHLEVVVGGEDDGIMLAFACGLFSVWAGIENIIPRAWAEKISKYDHERVTGISFHYGSIWLDLWRDLYGYADRKGIHLSFDIVDFLLGRPKYTKTLIQTGSTYLLLPEGRYTIKTELYGQQWKRSRSPLSTRMIKCELTPLEPIPIPGKGENSYDCDDDAIYSMTVAANSVDEAIAYLRDDVMKRRSRYGGDDWQAARVEANNWLDPTPEMLQMPEFQAVWNCIKSWDIAVPSAYGGYCGATGNHVRAILDALRQNSPD